MYPELGAIPTPTAPQGESGEVEQKVPNEYADEGQERKSQINQTSRMNTIQKKTLIGVIVALILVTTAVLVVLGVYGYLSLNPTVVPNPTIVEMTEEEMVEAIRNAVKDDKHKHVYVAFRLELQGEGEKLVRDFSPEVAKKYALKEVEVHASDRCLGSDKIEDKFGAMESIHAKIIIKPCIVQNFEKLMWMKSLATDMKLDTMKRGGIPIQQDVGKDVVRYLERGH